MSVARVGSTIERGAGPPPARLSPVDRLARRLVVPRLASLRGGQVTLVEGGDARAVGAEANPPGVPLRATVAIHDPRMYRQVAFGGSLGAAEAYLDGRWTCDDLTALLRLFARNVAATDRLERGGARLWSALARGAHALRRNTPLGSRRNIREHYDLGNDFFALFLDETMTYSCGIFEHAGASLRDASVAKLDRVCRRLDLGPDQHVLEIGTGWGSFALHAAGRYGCRVTTTTVSREQHDLASRRVREAGLDDRVTLLCRDYRDLEGRYDRIVSIEMIEAVGHAFLGRFFGTCAHLLRDEGCMLLQAITMPDHRYEQYRRSADFIQRYVFPGSCVPSVAAMTSASAGASDLRLVGLDSIGPHYETTLRRWRERFLDRRDAVRRLGYPERFLRMWEYYLCYCEAGFAERYLGAVQMLLARPGAPLPAAPPAAAVPEGRGR